MVAAGHQRIVDGTYAGRGAAAGTGRCKRGHRTGSEPYACRVVGCSNGLTAGYNQVRTEVMLGAHFTAPGA